jgi:hypothetical protein
VATMAQKNAAAHARRAVDFLHGLQPKPAE